MDRPVPISAAMLRHGFLSGGECLACEVCCRFPQPNSPLAPFFSHEEVARAVAEGMDSAAFPPGRYGAGHSPVLAPEGFIHRCPAFRVASNGCSIYEQRPLDCRLYPFMLTYTSDGREVRLGIDSYCPIAEQWREDPRLPVLAEEIARWLDGDGRDQVIARRGIVGTWKEHVRDLRSLPRLTRALCRDDLGLARLVLSARETLRPFFEAHRGGLSYHAFATIYAWSDVFDLHWRQSGDRLLIFAQEEGDALLLGPPFGAGDPIVPAGEALEVLRALAPTAPSPRMQEADDASAQLLVRGGWRIRETEVEYLHPREELAALAGSRYASKRQLCNRFEREHTWRWRSFEPEDLPAAAALYRRWLDARTRSHPGEIYAAQAEASFRSAYRALRDAEEMGLFARVLEVDGTLGAFTTGCALHDGRSLHVLHEIADPALRGAAQFTFRAFCREMTAFPVVNVGGHSGLANLASVKASYRPSETLRAHTLVPS